MSINLSFPVTSAPSPNHEGIRNNTIGVVIHSTRGGNTNPDLEFQGTINWFNDPKNQVSSHYLIGLHQVARIVDDDNIAWHAGSYANQHHIGIELVQPDPSWYYLDFQYQTLAEIVYKLSLHYNFPLVHVTSQYVPGILGHDETEQGKLSKKSDPGTLFNWKTFMNILTSQSVHVGEGLQNYISSHPDIGTPRHDSFYDLYGNEMVWLASSKSYPKGCLLVARKWLNWEVAIASWG